MTAEAAADCGICWCGCMVRWAPLRSAGDPVCPMSDDEKMSVLADDDRTPGQRGRKRTATEAVVDDNAPSRKRRRRKSRLCVSVLF